MNNLSTAKICMEEEYYSFGSNSIASVDRHGNPVEKTKAEYPYSYDEYVVFRLGKNKEANFTAYSDRLYQWNPKKYDKLCNKYFGSTAEYWNDRKITDIIAFLKDYFDAPELKLILLSETCNAAHGTPYWRFDVYLSKYDI